MTEAKDNLSQFGYGHLGRLVDRKENFPLQLFGKIRSINMSLDFKDVLWFRSILEKKLMVIE